ncbi:hypothetical protein ACIQ9P_26540 [Kitasatospora sp. NPDC094019]|uniref:hypothetical protein n=1 Tax=Kitasatospora sp. NPDC094019 TaxID=3364091 RepID=UPI0037FAA79F
MRSGGRGNNAWRPSQGRYREFGLHLYYRDGPLSGVAVDALCGPQVTAGGTALVGRVHSVLERWTAERAEILAVRLWRDHVRRSGRQHWLDHERGNLHWYCCGNPFEARALLDTVMNAMSPRSARELRKIVNRLDAGYRIPLPPHDGRGP